MVSPPILQRCKYDAYLTNHVLIYMEINGIITQKYFPLGGEIMEKYTIRFFYSG